MDKGNLFSAFMALVRASLPRFFPSELSITNEFTQVANNGKVSLA